MIGRGYLFVYLLTMYIHILNPLTVYQHSVSIHCVLLLTVSAGGNHYYYAVGI